MNNNHLPRKLITQVTKSPIRSTNKALTERKKVICVEPGAQDPESSVLTPARLHSLSKLKDKCVKIPNVPFVSELFPLT